jgi:hypothetical protein
VSSFFGTSSGFVTTIFRCCYGAALVETRQSAAAAASGTTRDYMTTTTTAATIARPRPVPRHRRERRALRFAGSAVRAARSDVSEA